MITIYVKLLNEGVDVWRPVNSKLIGPDLYLIDEKSVPNGEEWEFLPGAQVRVLEKDSDGKKILVAIKKV